MRCPPFAHKVFVRQTPNDKYIESSIVSFRRLPPIGLKIRVRIDEERTSGRMPTIDDEPEIPHKVDIFIIDNVEMAVRYFKPLLIPACLTEEEKLSAYLMRDESKVYMTRVGYEDNSSEVKK